MFHEDGYQRKGDDNLRSWPSTLSTQLCATCTLKRKQITKMFTVASISVVRSEKKINAVIRPIVFFEG